MQKQNKRIATQVFWYVSIIVATLMLVFGFVYQNAFYTLAALVIGILCRYFGNDILFKKLDQQLEERLERKRKERR